MLLCIYYILVYYKQFHHTDHRNHSYDHGSYHQQNMQKKGSFSTHKSLYNGDFPLQEIFFKFFINNTTEAGNQNVACPPEPNGAITKEIGYVLTIYRVNRS